MAPVETQRLELGMNPRLLLRGLVLISTLVAVGYLVDASHLGSVLDKSWIDSHVRGKGFSGELLFVGVGALVIAIGLPRQLVGFLSGYAFGFIGGAGYALAASVTGCIVAFYYARWFGRPVVKAHFAGRVQRLDDFIRGYPFSMTLLIRLLPVGSNVVTNLTAGVSSVSAGVFFLASALGYIPQTLVFALAGSGINLDPVLRISLALALFLVSGFLGAYLYRHFRRGRSFGRDLDRELGADGGEGS